MAFTGVDIYRTFQQRVAMAYTGFLSPTKATRLLRQSLYDSVEEKYRAISSKEDVKAYDEIRTYILTDVSFALTNNFIDTFTFSLQNYMRMLAVKAYFQDPIYNIPITAQTATTPSVITFTRRNNFRNEQMFIPTVGEIWLRKLNSFQFAVYLDSNFQTPVNITTNVVGQILSRIFFNWCKQISSTEKISPLVNPTANSPYYEITTAGIKIHPTTLPCTEIRLDYIKKLDEISVTSTQDYELFFPYKFISFVIEKACVLFGGESRDTEEVQLSQIQTQQNP